MDSGAAIRMPLCGCQRIAEGLERHRIERPCRFGCPLVAVNESRPGTRDQRPRAFSSCGFRIRKILLFQITKPRLVHVACFEAPAPLFDEILIILRRRPERFLDEAGEREKYLGPLHVVWHGGASVLDRTCTLCLPSLTHTLQLIR